MKVLEIVRLENGDVVLVEARSDVDANEDTVTVGLAGVETDPEQLADQPLVSIRFSPEVRDMLGDDVLGVAEAMIEAATVYISEEAGSDYGDVNGDVNGEFGADRLEPDLDDVDDQFSTAPVVLH